MLKHKVIPIALLASLACSLPVYAAPHPSDGAFDNKIVKRIKVDNIYETIDYLSKQPRVAGTKAEHDAAKYIEKQFKSYGYDTELQPFEFSSYKEPDRVSLSVSGYEDTEWELGNFTYGVSGQASGELVYAGLGRESDLEGVDLTGKIALIQRGEISFGDKVLNAARAGAEAVLLFNNSSGVINGTLGGPNDDFVPVLALTKAQGEELLAKLEAGESLTAAVEVEGARIEDSTSYNVIATKKPDKKKSTGQIIVVGAHHDSVEGAPGANDDASGTATTLELARVMANMPIDTELRFVTFGAEENGLLGSYAYVESLSEEEIESTVSMFQMDMVGSRDAGKLIMYTVDGEKNIVTDLGAAAGSRLSETVNYGREGRSDHVPFAEVGIPAALFIHAPVEPWYHTPEDSIDKISKDKLQEVAEIVGAAVYQIARPDTPALENARVAPKKVEYDFEERELE
ncbi:M28 family peptidase [Brevibacillus sp. FSL K6-2834]|uniref:M28 family peptidase n=1 Tax=Brevibacillus sp. FSL K6-2834 TaxID=2954680 RepID=UPI0031587593